LQQRALCGAIDARPSAGDKNTERDLVTNKNVAERIRRIAIRILFPVSPRLSKNFIRIDKAGLRSIENSINEHYHTGWRSESNYSKEEYEADVKVHLYERLESDRRMIVPWLDNAATLQNKRILEIGCGTGSSTIALAEQGSKITGIDIDEGALLVAEERSRIYGVDAEFRVLNAQEISKAFQAVRFDFIIFFASLEHMTIEERLTSLAQAWEMLPIDGLLVVVETPNRLWYFDRHTSGLPCFLWLPDELAFAYSRFSSREQFGELYREYNATSREHFLRRGMGVSFHEFDIAIAPAKNLNVISSLSTFLGVRDKLRKSRLDRRYKSIMMSICPDIHEGFLDEMLFLIIKK